MDKFAARDEKIPSYVKKFRLYYSINIKFLYEPGHLWMKLMWMLETKWNGGIFTALTNKFLKLIGHNSVKIVSVSLK